MLPKQFILENWKSTYRSGQSTTESLKLPKPFTVPSIDTGFKNFFYWDTYFTNIGLLLSGEIEQAKNNLENIAYLIKTHGFMPNADCLLDRSQPPLFARGVWDYYQATGDKSVPALFVSAIEQELSFWKNRRTDECGLSFYAFEDNGQAKEFFYGINPRVELIVDGEEQAEYEGKNLLAIAESGWDFTHRFQTETSPVDIQRFAPIDLNCILCEAEAICGKLFLLLGNEEKGNAFLNASEKRKALIESKMKREDGTYGDYDRAQKAPSSFRSAASFLPFVCGLSTDGEAYQKTLTPLELPYGVSATERVENGYQWDYPSVWPPLAYFAVVAAERTGNEETAKRLANKYLEAQDKIFASTNQLWEKYDGLTGALPKKSEYGTPPMMGWTAGTYLYLLQK